MFASASSRLLLLGALTFLAGFAISVSGDTYSVWKARVFSDTEQADPAISGELALSPAGDGITNLLKYAFGLDPHRDGSAGMPQVGLMQGVDSQSGQPTTFLTITYRVSSSDYPSDLYFIPEFSADLQTWRHGDAVFAPPVLQPPASSGDPGLVTSQALSPVMANSKGFVRLRVLEGQMLPEEWQVTNFGRTGVEPDGDADGDGVSNFDEFLHGTDPNDYYSRVVPELAVVSGDNQQGDPSSLLALPLVVRVRQQGRSVVNAPVQFSVPADSGVFSLSPSGDSSAATLTSRTNFDGLATAYFQLPAIPSLAITISISSGGASTSVSASTNAGHETPPATMSIVSGNNQAGLPGQYLEDPFVVRLLGPDGQPIAGAAITLSAQSGGGEVVVDRFNSPPSDSITLITDNEGLAWAYYLQGTSPGALSQVSATSNEPAAQTSFAAITVSQAPTTPRRVAAGAYHTLACYSDGTVWAWGYNAYGQLGDGTTADRWHREQVVGLTNVISVSTHADTSAALRSDGTVWIWGDNVDHALGDGGSERQSTTPVQVLQGVDTPLTNVVAIASGYSHGLALKADGTVWAWGSDWGYQLGNTSESASAFAVPVLMEDSTPLQNVAAIACGDDHNLALEADGTVWTWGYNGDDQLGTGDSDWRRASPALVPGLTNLVAVAAGASHSVALKSDGTVWSWGANWAGFVGDGTTGGTRPTPVQAQITNVIAIAAGYSHTLALRSDGTVWAWGDNSYGQLAVANSVRHYSALPVQIEGLAGMISVSAGGDHGFGVAANGSLLGWGSNFSGELGHRSRTDEVATPRPVTDFLLTEDPDHDGLASWREQKLGGDPNAYSTVGDTISDGWKAQYNVSLTDVGLASRDLTNKGLTVLQDYQLGTDPTKFSTVDDGIADGWKVRYQLDPLDPALAGEDPSGKGWAVRMDYQLGTDPTRVSTLNDGIPDKWKVDHNVNPLDSGYANRDDDQDGLVNAEEYAVGTDPDNPDTDGDGVADGRDGFALDPDLHPPRLPNYSYAVIDLGDGTARAINSKNQVVGDKRGVFFWDKGERKDFDPSGNGADTAVGINDSGVALFNHINGSPSLWHSDDGTETVLRFTNGPIPNRFDFDPNIVFSTVVIYGAAGISNSGYVAAGFQWLGSYVPAYAGNGFIRAAIWKTDYSSAVLLDTVPDANDRVLTVDDRQEHGFRKDYNNTVDSWNFNGHYDNTHGLDNQMYGISMNKSDQIVANTINQEGVSPWGFPFFGSTFVTVTVWTNNEPEIVVRDPGSHLYADAINDEGVIAGINTAEHTALWVKVNSEWKEKDLGKWFPYFERGLIRLNKNLQLVAGHLLSQNDQLSDLLTRIGPQYSNLVSLGINEAGIIVGQADISAGNIVAPNRAVILVPAALLPDYNRDGVIDDKDRSKVTEDNPYRFWTNDDTDDGNTGGDDIPTGGGGNGIDDHVNGTRDLVDFFPVFLDIKQLLEILPSDKFDYSLACEDPFLNYVVTDLTPDTVRDYLIKLDSTTGGLDSAGALSSQPVQNVGLNGRKLDTAFLDRIQNEGKGIILVESRSKVTHPLKLQITKHDTGEEVGDVELPLSIDDVEKMYRHVNFLYLDNAEGGRPTEAAEPPNYPDQLCSPKIFVFVHGYNVNPDQARGWNAEMFKRMWWSGSRAKFYGITWHSDEKVGVAVVPDYHKNVDNGFATAEHLALVLRNLGSNVTVAAHSLGNLVVGSTVHDWSAAPANYFMIDAAIPVEAYDGGTPIETAMMHPGWNDYRSSADQNYRSGDRVFVTEWHANPQFVQSDARALLTWRDRLSRVGSNTYNFFSSSEDVLRKHEGDPGLADVVKLALTGGRFAWALQEKLKGRQIAIEIQELGGVGRIGSTYGGWRFSENIGNPPHTPSASEALQLDNPSLAANPVFDPGFKLTIYSPSPEHPDGEIVKEVHPGAPDWIIDLTDPDKGNAIAGAHANQLLAEMFPARTLPAGGNLLRSLGNTANFDMPLLYTNGWPAERGGDGDWRHSDIKDVAYPFVYRVFDKFTSLGGLK